MILTHFETFRNLYAKSVMVKVSYLYFSVERMIVH